MSATSGAVILTYHSISNGPPPLAIPPALFAGQMEWLKENSRVVPLDEIVSALVEQRPFGERVVALTFDDGYRDFSVEAFPVLRRLQFPATVFLPTDHCGQTSAWPGQPPSVREQPLMSWREISELAAAGIEFGSHSASHPMLDRIPADALDYEIAGSKDAIAARTGRTPDFFCYPYGIWGPAVREVVRRHYRGACSTAAAFVGPKSDPYALPRVDAHYARSPAWFRRLFTPSFVGYMALRRFIRRVRRQPEGYVSELSS